LPCGRDMKMQLEFCCGRALSSYQNFAPAFPTPRTSPFNSCAAQSDARRSPRAMWTFARRWRSAQRRRDVGELSISRDPLRNPLCACGPDQRQGGGCQVSVARRHYRVGLRLMTACSIPNPSMSIICRRLTDEGASRLFAAAPLLPGSRRKTLSRPLLHKLLLPAMKNYHHLLARRPLTLRYSPSTRTWPTFSVVPAGPVALSSNIRLPPLTLMAAADTNVRSANRRGISDVEPDRTIQREQEGSGPR
jgi:hypothetical protein